MIIFKSKLTDKTLQVYCYIVIAIISLPFILKGVSHFAIQMLLVAVATVGTYFAFNEKQRFNAVLFKKYENMAILLNNIYKYYPDYIICKDENLNLTLCNKQLVNHFRLNHISEFRYKYLDKLFEDENSNIVIDSDKRVLKQGKVERYTIYVKSKDIYYECLSIPLRQDRKICGLITLIKNITEESKLRDELSENYFQVESLIKNLPMIAFVMDSNGNYIMGNPQSYKFYTEGIDPDNPNIQIDLQAISEMHHEENKQIIENGNIIETEKHLKTIDGDYHWYSWKKVPLIAKSGEKKGVIVFIKNIDAAKNVQKQRDNYIATLSHDLKTPTLAQIRTIELLLKGTVGDFNAEQYNLLKLMLDSSHYMYSMVETLVSTYKFENGEVLLTYEQFNILELIQETIENLDELIKNSKVNIKIESKVNIPIINADKEQLRKAIENLISNGVSYGYKNTTLTILINEIKENGTPKICVKFINNSPHMSQETINNVFKKYVSHADKFNRVGAGLGLYLFKQIIDAHKGNVFVTSTKDDINTFGFVINK